MGEKQRLEKDLKVDVCVRNRVHNSMQDICVIYCDIFGYGWSAAEQSPVVIIKVVRTQLDVFW